MSKTDNVNGYEGKKTINWYPGHMAKTKREIAEKLNLIDVVYEVIDARMPLSSKIVDIDDLIKDKPRILVMTKYDLCDEDETNKFVKYYEEQGYKVVITNFVTVTNMDLRNTFSGLILPSVTVIVSASPLTGVSVALFIVILPLSLTNGMSTSVSVVFILRRTRYI